MAAHTGEVNEFEDILGSSNFIGDGLNDCTRYLEIKSFAISTVMVSNTAYENLKNFLYSIKTSMLFSQKGELKKSTVQDFKDKHGFEKRGCLIWLRKSGIINPPNINYNSII